MIAKNLKYKRLSALENNLDMEICAIELSSVLKNTIVISLYRPPNTNETAFLESYKRLLLALRKESGKHVILCMDHNFNLLKSHVHMKTRDFLNTNLDNEMWLVITKPTHLTHSSSTLIDNIFVSNDIYSSYQCGLLIDDLSDHLPCYLIGHNLKLKKKEVPVITSRKITPKTLTKIKDTLISIDWQSVTNKESVNIAFKKFHEKIVSVLDNIAPYETFIPGKYSYHKEPWIPIGLLRSIKKQRVLYKKTLGNNATIHDLNQYKNYRNTLTKLKRSCKCEYYRSKCEEFKSNTKALWSVINKISGKHSNKTNMVTCLENDGIVHTNTTKIANIFNDHFASVGSKYICSIKESKKNISIYLQAISNNTYSCH